MKEDYVIIRGKKKKLVTEPEDPYEALHWLENNRNESPFASNRFWTKRSIIRAVKRLYEAGAYLVRISGIYDEPYRIQREGGPYADVLIVHTTEDRMKDVLKVIVGLCPDEFREEDNNTFYLWWD